MVTATTGEISALRARLDELRVVPDEPEAPPLDTEAARKKLRLERLELGCEQLDGIAAGCSGPVVRFSMVHGELGSVKLDRRRRHWRRSRHNRNDQHCDGAIPQADIQKPLSLSSETTPDSDQNRISYPYGPAVATGTRRRGCVDAIRGDWRRGYTDGAAAMNLLAYICWLRDNGFIWGQSRERPGQPLSNSEIRRWIVSGAIEVNSERPKDIEYRPRFPVDGLVLFAGGKRQCTLL